MTIPSERNIALKEIENKSKYKDFEDTEYVADENRRQGWQKTSTKYQREQKLVKETQMISMLGSARILRKVLSVCIYIIMSVVKK